MTNDLIRRRISFFYSTLLLLINYACQGASPDEGPMKVRGRIVLQNKEHIVDSVPTLKDENIFGRSMSVVAVDAKTSAIADVFVWTFEKPEQPAPESRSHDLVLTTKGYFPRSIIMNANDCIRIINTLPIGDAITIDKGKIASHLRLDREVASTRIKSGFDRPIAIESELYPFLTSAVFARQRADCTVSDQRGEFALRELRSKPKTFHLWHAYLPNLRIVSVPDGCRIVTSDKFVVDGQVDSVIGDVVIANVNTK